MIHILNAVLFFFGRAKVVAPLRNDTSRKMRRKKMEIL